MPIKLKGQLIQLRAMEPSDAFLIYQWENNTDNWLISNTATPFSKDIIEQYVNTAADDIYTTKQLRLMIETCSDNQAIGTLDMFDFDPLNRRAGLGILIADSSQRRQGFASEALDLFIQYSFQILDLHQLYCNILSSNKYSIDLFQSKGFNTIGLKKQWIRNGHQWEDEYMLQLLNPHQ